MNSMAETISARMLACCAGRERLLVAIDGRCASGKSTLAGELRRELDCAVFHMDDFFPRPEQRTDERLRTPGGNVDYERFGEEVLFPLRRGAEQVVLRTYDCAAQALRPPVRADAGRIVLIEGSYSCHPALWDAYDLRIFLTVSAQEQAERIRARNGEDALRVFLDRWIPLEERYFAAFRIQERCDLCFDTGGSAPDRGQ